MEGGLLKVFEKFKQIGFMQGRLINSEKKNSIQYFPAKNWKKEIKIAEINNLLLMEWTINYENIKKNFMVDKKIKFKNLEYIKKSNVKIESVTCDFFMQKPYFKKKYIKYKLEISKYIINLINNCEKLGIRYIILPLVDNSSISGEIEEINLIHEVKKFDKLLNNVQILFEIDYCPTSIKRFIEKFDKKKFGINYDTGNSAALGYNIKEEMNYFEDIKNIHIKDRLYKGQSVRLGEGDYKFNILFKILKKKYKGNLILQTARSKNNNHLFEIKRNLDFIKKFI